MNRIITLLASIVLLVFTFYCHAQQTGSFNTQVNIMGQSRNLSCYVPTNYSAGNSYRLMIGLHGLGDNSSNYRNALTGPLGFQNNFPNTIFICPDGGSDANRDFYTPAGDEAIIDSTIAFAMQNYSIDSSFVVLQGFSLGGRSAAKFGLDQPSRFKGLLLNTPALQGKQDMDNTAPTSLNLNYSNASQLPIYITVGEQDVLYYLILNEWLKKLKKQDAVVNYLPVANLGHTVPDSAKVTPSYAFFQNPAAVDYDLDLFDADLPKHICASSVAPTCYVQNRGGTTITSLEIDYQFAGGSGTHTWNGNIGAYQHAAINLPSINTLHGEQVLSLSVGSVNGGQTDTVTANNQFMDTTEVDLQAMPLSLSEGFETNAPGWVINQFGPLFYWYRDTDVKKTGQASLASFNTILLFYTRGNVESFESPVMDLSTLSQAKLTYDIAYNYHKYTPPYFPADTIFADTLEVAISTDCGQSWQSLYKKSGPDLATAANPILNPLSLGQVFFTPLPSEWRSDTIDLSAFDTEKEAIIRFNYISDNGGSINIDNILLSGQGLSLQEFPASSFEMYPNPAHSQLSLSMGKARITNVHIYDVSGNRVHSQAVKDHTKEPVTLHIGDLPTGIYQVEVEANSRSLFRKLMVAD